MAPLFSLLVTGRLRHHIGGVDTFGSFPTDGSSSPHSFGVSPLSGDVAVRNNVRRLVRGTLAVSGLVSALALTGAGTAAADTIESKVPVAIDGPVAALAILLGVGGMVAGLWRHRRRVVQQAREQAAEAAAAIVDPTPAPTQV
ncbi:hypothetical protein GCM10010174_09970 [Kutzneria viridogrisea]